MSGRRAEFDPETRWIWSPGDPAPADSYTWFRADFTAERPASVRISADVRYRAWFDGQLIGEGPPLSAPDAVYVDTHDLDQLLSADGDDDQHRRHCLAVVVRCTGVEPGRRAGPLAEVVDASGNVVLATGDHRWRCRRAEAWGGGTAAFAMNRFEPHQEVFDARREPEGWRLAGFDDSEWPAPVNVTTVGTPLPDGQWDTLLERPIPPMEEAVIRPGALSVDECVWLETRSRPDLSIRLSQVGRPLTTATVDGQDHLLSGTSPVIMKCSDDHLRDHTVDGVYDPCVTLDYGRQNTAYVELDIEGPAGATIDIGLAERLVDGHFNNAIEGQFASRYVLKEGRQYWRSAVWRGFRYLRIRVGQTGPDPVIIHDLRAIRTRYPYAEAGVFRSDDQQLNQIFELCRHTVRLCSHESIMDTPWREQAQWLGDISAVTAPAIRTLFGDTALVEKFIDQAARTVADQGTLASISNGAAKPGVRPGRDIPDYTLWWVIDLLDHFHYTGDQDFLLDHLPALRKVLTGLTGHCTEQGTLRSFGWVFIDWADVDTDGESAALNAIYYGALRAAARIAGLTGSSTDQQEWTERADRLQQIFADRFWSTAEQVFIDAVHADGSRSTKISEQTNFAAIRFGLIDGEQAGQLAERVLDAGATEAQPFFASVLLDALYRIGRTDRALQLIIERWGGRMLDRGATSCFEEWGINGSWRSGSYAGFMRTESHAWGAHPATFLIRNLLGVEILEPGCRRIRLDPYAGLTFSATYPTPLGPVAVDVGPRSVHIDAPPAVAVEFHDHQRASTAPPEVNDQQGSARSASE